MAFYQYYRARPIYSPLNTTTYIDNIRLTDDDTEKELVVIEKICTKNIDQNKRLQDENKTIKIGAWDKVNQDNKSKKLI